MNTPTPAITPDQKAAHEFLSELRTRISTQPLPYQYGVEARALESLWEIFEQGRAAMKGNPGCSKFADAVTEMLNMQLRPVTAKWHRAYVNGRLDSKDGADEFRSDLAMAQEELRAFAGKLHEMAYDSADPDRQTPPAVALGELNKCFLDLKFGIPEGAGLSQEAAKKINDAEGKEINDRRKTSGDGRLNAVGVGFSGGGIRSRE